MVCNSLCLELVLIKIFKIPVSFEYNMYLHNFFLSLLLLIRCILSLSQAFLNNTELKIFGRHRESNPGPLV